MTQLIETTLGGLDVLQLDCGCVQSVRVHATGTFEMKHRRKGCGRDGSCARGNPEAHQEVAEWLKQQV